MLLDQMQQWEEKMKIFCIIQKLIRMASTYVLFIPLYSFSSQQETQNKRKKKKKNQEREEEDWKVKDEDHLHWCVVSGGIKALETNSHLRV